MCRGTAVALAFLALPLLAAACSVVPSSGRADLPPTLSFQDEPGGAVPFESGQPVPTFDRQPRVSEELGGTWRFDPEPLDSDLSLANRDRSLSDITAEVGRRAEVIYDDSQWQSIDVPGTFNPPSDRTTTGGYYRTEFYLAPEWSGKYAMLKFGAVRYIADVWLNNHYLGYHEGGDTPFALDATQALQPGAYNSLLVRVDNPEWGTRDDIVPWGLADWWNYGGIVGDVWLEAPPSLSAVRADVTPHLDGADVSIVVQHRGSDSVKAALDVRLWPAQVNASNRLDPEAASLIPSDALPLFERNIDLGTVGGDSVFRVEAPFAIREADLWTPAIPALYVLQVTVIANDQSVDDLFTSFGLRQIKVDSTAPRLLLNGLPVAFDGVALHEERQEPPRNGWPAGGPLTSPQDIYSVLQRALDVHADLVRVDHHPPNQMLPVLADRLGLALWEEVPLYHFTPQTFGIAMDRGIPQQMLTEMDLRDFNRPSVMFHGFANESTGGSARASALNALHALDKRIDGTRLTGQAAYGTDPADPTNASLDVAGYTFYYGVLYGGGLSGAVIQDALMRAHAAFPHKPVMVMEYGHWADDARDEVRQVRVFDTYYTQISPDFDTEQSGFIGAAVWWTLDDYWTQRPGLTVESFGLYRPDGSLRPAGVEAAKNYALTAPAAARTVRSGGVAAAIVPGEKSTRLLPYIAYGFAVPAAFLLALIFVLSRVPRRRPTW
ncbi:MAG TPA: glycoside hydrolase family 2 TIM barrel-domain containing protein [Candidatus Dormibacteraeota bacterium]|nr:glycoside hydrolase family 2 TIM barrel-domain containing protein [Candidatus Dormibacteraeota bacterium]